MIDKMLQDGKAELVSNKKHQKWKLPNGFLFVMPNTPSDWRSDMNSLHVLRKLFGRSPWENELQIKL